MIKLLWNLSQKFYLQLYTLLFLYSVKKCLLLDRRNSSLGSINLKGSAHYNFTLVNPYLQDGIRTEGIYFYDGLNEGQLHSTLSMLKLV